MKKKIISEQRVSSDCIVCGWKNNMGLFTRFYVLEDGSLASISKPKEHHQSFPGRVHGGIITAILDETMARTAMITNQNAWCVTGDINVRFKKPVPYDENITTVAWITKENRKLLYAEARMFSEDGTLCATAKGTFMKFSLKEISGEELINYEDWYELDKESPAYIELPDNINK